MLTYVLCELLCNVLLGKCKRCLAFSCRRVGLVYDHKSDQHAPRPHTVSQAEHLVQRSTHRGAHYGVPGYADSEGNHDGEDGECGSEENDGGGLRERYKGGSRVGLHLGDFLSLGKWIKPMLCVDSVLLPKHGILRYNLACQVRTTDT